MAAYAYEECLERSYRINWKIKDVLGTVGFDRGRPWLPAALSGAKGIFCLNAEEKRKLTQVEMGAYAHLFGFVEAFIAPEMVELARASETVNRVAFEALTNFASEEIKHMRLFREVRKMVDRTLGFPLELLEGQDQVAQVVLGKHQGAVLLLTSAIEWFTQHHFLSAMKDADELDPLTKEIFRCHWLEEAQHARLDHLETVRVFREMTEADRDQAIEDLIWLLAAVDGLLQQQVAHDVTNLGRYLGRAFTAPERQEIHRNLLRAKRHCFIESGMVHPNFQELFLAVTTPAQQAGVRGAVDLLLQEQQGPPAQG
ncbi:diiron oxygenase [Geothrix fuzhouensis]|uniref:diiron oxygenase n=1 Tax=Geothrix fuzhouensis TaxID=2966451 RepID=UPI0021472821|nr:diiron oxygenase [Geothrix fuzhouensis]